MPNAIHFRPVRADDLPAVLALIADDMLGALREDSSPVPSAAHLDAFAAIESDPNNDLMLACFGERPVGFLQITWIPGLSRQGAWRAQVEAVRVASDQRSRGIGQAMMAEVIRRARLRGCRLIQLTTDKRRTDAHRFYLRLGFSPSHQGMKLELDAGQPDLTLPSPPRRLEAF